MSRVGYPHQPHFTWLRRDTLDAVSREVMRARAKHPTNTNLLPALVEEVGELAQALADKHGRERVVAEAIQVACVALRIVEEGEPAFESEVAP